MGTYLNPGKAAYEEAVNSEIFIDKSEMIGYLNTVVKTKQKYVSVSRPRRFGKTMAADMICAYYDREADSRDLFEQRKLSNLTLWDAYLGKFDVIRLVMTDFLEGSDNVQDMIAYLTAELAEDLRDAYPEVDPGKRNNLRSYLNKIYGKTKCQFVIVIDEWDAVFRIWKDDNEAQRLYLDFLRDFP